MKKLYAFLFVFLISILCFAQNETGASIDSTTVKNDLVEKKSRRNKKHTLNIESGYFFGSDAITGELASAYLQNQFITDEMKDRVSSAKGTNHRFGAGFNYKLSYRYHPDTLFGLSNAFYTISFKDSWHYDAGFNKDVFELYFRGNKNYAGKTADLNDFTFQQLIFQQLNFTLGRIIQNNSSFYSWIAGISINKGQQFLDINIPEAGLYTDPSGLYLDLNSDIELRRNDSLKNEKASVNGIGASVDLAFNFYNKKKNKFSISIDNLGFINWNNQSAFISADTAFRFEGIDISDIFDFNDSINGAVSLDSSLVQPYLTERIKKNYQSLLPAFAKIEYTISFTKKLEGTAGIGNLFFANSTLMEWLKVKYKISSHHSAGIQFRNGGYSGFCAGLQYEYKNDSWKIHIRSDELSSIISGGRAHGAFLSLSKYF